MEAKIEFKNTPPIEEWPDKAKWATLTKYGYWEFWTKKPKCKSYFWSGNWDGEWWASNKREPEETRKFWHKSLQKRPDGN